MLQTYRKIVTKFATRKKKAESNFSRLLISLADANNDAWPLKWDVLRWKKLAKALRRGR